MLNRYIGEIVEINPTWEETKLVWVTSEQWEVSNLNDNGTFINSSYPYKIIPHHNPTFWFEYKGWMYYGLVEYEIGFAEQFEDWQMTEEYFFDQYEPSEIEFNQLINFKGPMNKVKDPGVPYKTIYFKLDYPKAMQGDLGHWCKYEMDFTKQWYRDRTINDILG